MSDNFDVSIGEHSTGIAVGKGIIQNQNDIHIHLDAALKSLTAFADEPSPIREDRSLSGYDWVTIALVTVFVLFYIIAVAVPVTVYQFSTRNPAPSDVQNWMLALSSMTSGVTGLIGVSVGYRLARRK